jgi:hypothetical protein
MGYIHGEKGSQLRGREVGTESKVFMVPGKAGQLGLGNKVPMMGTFWEFVWYQGMHASGGSGLQELNLQTGNVATPCGHQFTSIYIYIYRHSQNSSNRYEFSNKVSTN